MTNHRRALVVALLALATAGCGDGQRSRLVPAAAGSSSGTSAADMCATYARPVADTDGNVSSVDWQGSVTAAAFQAWQAHRYAGGPAPSGFPLSDPQARLAVCIYDGTFHVAVPAPPGAALPPQERLSLVVDTSGGVQLDFVGPAAAAPTSRPQASPSS